MPETAIPGGYILGFDFGLRRIGVAVGQTATHTASSLETVRNGKTPDWPAIDRLVKEWKPSLLLVG
ncbi:MAG: Holliday junction resolvase RuvX, partial [Gammaproteobacteria bacterium]|nr:Holliday junction resolvase RuvX [Gammaproteobacteria bacterium]